MIWALGVGITQTDTEGEFGTLYRAFAYSTDGNNLVSETDTRGYTTTYTVDPETSRNKAVTDRYGNTTAYDYDDSGRTTKVTSKDATGTELAHVGYTYDAFDNLTAIARGDGMAYTLAYTPFHDLESIDVAGKAEKLVTDTHKNANKVKSIPPPS